MKQVKYLGLTIGERMNFIPHLKATREKMTTIVAVMNRVLRVNDGMSRTYHTQGYIHELLAFRWGSLE